MVKWHCFPISVVPKKEGSYQNNKKETVCLGRLGNKGQLILTLNSKVTEF